MYLFIKFFKFEIKKKLIDQIENCSDSNLGNILKEIYKRIIVPIYIPILMLTPLLLITSSKENSNYSKLRIFTFLIGVFVIIFSETTIRLVSKNLINNLSIIIIPIIVLIIFYLFYFKKFNYFKFTK